MSLKINKDVSWNYLASVARLSTTAFILVFIIRTMPPEKAAIWIIFTSITSFSGLLDLGFGPSFTRNITYVYSGVTELKRSGFQQDRLNTTNIDFSLLKNLIKSMQWYYARSALILFSILISLGSFYIHKAIANYDGNLYEIYISWFLLVISNCYNLYTLYYDSLLQGRGLIKSSKQIFVIGQLVYIIFAWISVSIDGGFISLIFSQLMSFIVIRQLSKKKFFDKWTKKKLNEIEVDFDNSLIKILMPNSIKTGLTTLGGFLASRSTVIIGSLYVSLDLIASYGLTIQLIKVIAGFAGLYFASLQPKFVEYRVAQEELKMKVIFIRTNAFIIATFLAGGLLLIYFGEFALKIIGSKTGLLEKGLIIFLLLSSLLESIHTNAGYVLLTKNEVPFFKASLIAGALSIILLFYFLISLRLEVLALIIAPFIAHLYNNWKWPFEVIKELRLRINDIKLLTKTI